MKIIFDSDPVRIDKYLSELPGDYTRSFLQKQIKEGYVTVNGKPVRPSYQLQDEDIIEMDLPEIKEPEILPCEIPLDILYEDDDVLIVNKPKGMVVHPAPGHYDDTMVNALMAYCKDDLSGIGGVARPGIVHRIDKNTSGSLLVCKNDRAHQAVSAQLKDHSIKRIYIGIVCGYPAEEKGTIRGNIGRDPKNRKRMAIVPAGKGKPAVTHYQILERFKGYSLVKFELETGRTHQIRVHMASIHHPLMGDELYGSASNPFGIEGHMLHAQTLGFIHPISGEFIECTAPMPEEFDLLLEQMRRLC